MYEQVKSSKQQKVFEHTWEYFCQKYGWYNDPYSKNGIRYNLLLPYVHEKKQNKVIGTIEFIPYNPKNPNSTVEGRCNFIQYEEIRSNQHRIWEIDKLCIHQEYQRKGHFQSFMAIFYDHAKKNKPKYYLALIEKKFFRMLRISFGIGIIQKGKALEGPTTALIPIVFDVENIMQNEEKVRELLGGTYNSEGPALLRKMTASQFLKHLLNRCRTWPDKLKN
ncbi:hypothetical protein [Metabacillus arenae]|uniref:Uncharacterized protein n=1 Tax=Metabacillus arenae TaxID=2771434 RepID=A0A926NGV8_9BACI|nr:hypothetical protein [Metabacillus arenae]MBD1380845.1 hypothetical protein [Metabacillus arenae]